MLSDMFFIWFLTACLASILTIPHSSVVCALDKHISQSDICLLDLPHQEINIDYSTQIVENGKHFQFLSCICLIFFLFFQS